jgi:DNA-binding MarR family transcriptional regulator
MLDAHVLDGLMADLVGHDRRPGAYLVYLALTRLCAGTGSTSQSLQALANATGLSKSAVQRALRHLERRRMVETSRETATAIPRYTLLRPWVRTARATVATGSV